MPGCAPLAALAPPEDPDCAEDTLVHTVAVLVPELAHAPVAEQQRPVVARILKAGGRRERITAGTAVAGLGSAMSLAPGDLARAVMLLVARSPRLFAHHSRAVAGLPSSTVFPVLEQAPRYLAWLGAQGHLGTVHPWAAIVAADLGRRIRWRQLAPGRGAGRLLWICEQMATPPHAAAAVPTLWRAAAERGVRSPDWPHAVPPRHCRLEHGDYVGLLRERTTGCTLNAEGDRAAVEDLISGALITWTGRTTARTPVTGAVESAYPLPAEGDNPVPGAAAFTRRGDYTATGWLARHYLALAPDDA
ncbi:hypothetical protein G3I59_14100 [Amycolatopsis rubida]|uniref:Uncharacterized protein n=1 Tax=Amycolatopsis rubida TaxID=112413 RepID=A0ABX0BSM1_9PSEU|nr:MULTISPECIES: hypothetical protein [Amycolatopsis]MYW91704.1 hypothetical protein [Amycolatopsis rubida]NEC56688.1 hypothetical protein [Amycolatopsis rubida]OAP20420.1 hypothetical protein A4R44_08844 [Amycolatopsis sp. M39]